MHSTIYQPLQRKSSDFGAQKNIDGLHVPLGLRYGGRTNAGSLALNPTAVDQMPCLVRRENRDIYGRPVNPNTIDTEKTHCPLATVMYRESRDEGGRTSTLARYANLLVN